MSLPEVPSPGSLDPPVDPRDPSVLAELTAAVAARDVLIAVAAHELRNPMTPMIGQIDLLLTGLRAGRLSPAEIEQRLARIHQAMTNYLKRATALLDVSRLTSGQFRLRWSPSTCRSWCARWWKPLPRRPVMPGARSESSFPPAWSATGITSPWSRSSTTSSPTP